jgi:hypothetical protein
MPTKLRLIVSVAGIAAAFGLVVPYVYSQAPYGKQPMQREITAFSNEGNAVFAESGNVAVFGGNPSSGNKAYLGTRCCAGDFYGPVYVHGTLQVVGGPKNFVIDHPLDPGNKSLYHASIESSEMKNLYDGVVTLDTRGEATVVLPDWFGALNKEFRYQLTPIGASAPELHVSSEIANNRFTIAGGGAGQRVSWMVTGVRNDPWAQAHPMIVEVPKAHEH